MKVFNGWYRESLAHKNTVWHRVCRVYSILGGRQMAHTVCGKSIPTTKYEFDMKPDNRCLQCEGSPGIISETDRGFAPIDTTAIHTKADAIYELKRLLKPRTYYLKLWRDQNVCIKAEWESGVDIDVYTETETITKKKTMRVMTLEQIQADLGRFKSEIDCLGDATNVLALASKRKKKIKERLTKSESQAYFDELLHEAEK